VTPSVARGEGRGGKAKLSRRLGTLATLPLRLGYVALGLFGAALACLAIVTPLDLRAQAAFGLFTLGLFFAINRIKDQRGRLGLIVLSMLVSTRYMWWRTTETLGFTDPFDAFFGYGLYLAELYGWIVLMIGYFQIIYPLDRKPKALPADVKLWPVVDVYVPTYNESLDVVGPTVLAAMAMDYPADRFKVFILDDGRRPEFARFAREAGCGYIVRDNNNHAKAGNLNNALTVTNGELIAIFDCDHVPTRAFLQMTVGHFLHDPKLSMVQTPHHFYSPDPFERNLNTFGRVPNEGQLFYGLIQPGNDFWNAAFFCGSCAVISREALLSVGGVQHQTVTEDAHTALRMQRKGWNTAFLALPLAAGLATERLSVHIGQRMRWARGMIQLFRTDNPLFGRGLKFGQRICYLNAMMYFLYPLPRFVFLTSPLAYLLLQQNIIMASALTVMAYAGPHLFHTIGTRSRIDGKARYSFWGEIYDNVLLFHIIGPTLRALINPKAGKFNVTDKGGIIDSEEYDSKAMKPLMILVGLLFAAGCFGLYRLNLTDLYQGEREVILMNVFWCLYSMFTLLAALAVGRERRQMRVAPRVDMKVPVTLYYDGRHSLVGKTVNVSLLGAMLRFDEVPPTIRPGDEILLNFDFLTGNSSVPARVIGSVKRDVRLEFKYESLADKQVVVRAVFGRADAWLHWTNRPTDHVAGSLADLLGAISSLLDYVKRRPIFQWKRKPKPVAAVQPAPLAAHAVPAE
jgi:cellulose synthase (UDP-forming)